MQISGRNLNKVQAALTRRSAILESSLRDETAVAKTEKANFYDEDIKMVSQHTLNPKFLTPTEKDEAVTRYESGMSMTAVANLYGCHRTTIRDVLQAKGIATRNHNTKK